MVSSGTAPTFPNSEHDPNGNLPGIDELSREQAVRQASKCIICLENVDVDSRITCTNDHVTCKPCLEKYVVHQADCLRDTNMLVEKANEAEAAGNQRELEKMKGACFCCQEGCQAPAFNDREVMRCLTDAGFQKFIEGKTRHPICEGVQKAVSNRQEINTLIPNARQCGRCGCGPILIDGCSNMMTHHGEAHRGSREKAQQLIYANSCPTCGWFVEDASQWPRFNPPASALTSDDPLRAIMERRGAAVDEAVGQRRLEEAAAFRRQRMERFPRRLDRHGLADRLEHLLMAGAAGEGNEDFMLRMRAALRELERGHDRVLLGNPGARDVPEGRRQLWEEAARMRCEQRRAEREQEQRRAERERRRAEDDDETERQERREPRQPETWTDEELGTIMRLSREAAHWVRNTTRSGVATASLAALTEEELRSICEASVREDARQHRERDREQGQEQMALGDDVGRIQQILEQGKDAVARVLIRYARDLNHNTNHQAAQGAEHCAAQGAVELERPGARIGDFPAASFLLMQVRLEVSQRWRIGVREEV